MKMHAISRKNLLIVRQLRRNVNVPPVNDSKHFLLSLSTKHLVGSLDLYRNMKNNFGFSVRIL